MKRIISLLTAVAMMGSMIPAAMAENASSGVKKTVWEEANGKFYSDYETLAEERIAAKELNIELASEGFVLLKNANGALPLRAEENRVTLFGNKSYNLQLGGGGSGSGRPGIYGVPTTTLVDSMDHAGLYVNQKVKSAYGSANTELDADTFTKAMTSSYASYNDAAIVTIARTGAEGAEEARHDVPGNADPNKHYLELTDAEVKLIHHVKANFDKVIVLINSANVMEAACLAEEKTADNLGVDAILWIAHTGNDGAEAIGRILTGTVNPSGHTVDTWEVEFAKGPTYTNIGDNSQNYNEDGTRMDNNLYVDGQKATGGSGGDLAANFSGSYHSVEYREGIYQGYKYYETLYDTAPEGAKEEAYSNVLYPFGYGLSYTSFDWELLDDVAETETIAAADQQVTLKVKVTNTGNVAGKDVVQLYSNPPYTAGGIEKATANLMAFGKTKLLQPGESEILTISFPAQEMASFDWNDANKNGFQGYELENGAYIISARHNSHDIEFAVTRTIDETILCKTDYVTGNEIKAVFSQPTGEYARYYTVNDALLNNLISRTDLKQPAASTIADRTVTAEYIQMLESEQTYFSYQDKEEDLWYVDEVPAEWTQAAERAAEKAPIQLMDLAGVPYTEPDVVDGVATAAQDEDSQLWEAFMNQFTWDELVHLINCGMYANPVVMDFVGKPRTWGGDGPTQFGWNAKMITGHGDGTDIGTNWVVTPIVAATWNQELAAEQGRMIGNESLLLGVNDWMGPGMNTHRSPFSGRNFEYYSEDGMQAAYIASAVVYGVTSKGVAARMKHMVLNDQETNRNTSGGIITWATEQAIREIYLKPFEYSVKYGGATGAMTSFNRIGDAVTSTNYALLENIFRDEWNFKGTFMTDYQDYAAYRYTNLMARTGQELPMGGVVNFGSFGMMGDASAVEGTWSVEENCVLVSGNNADAVACETMRQNDVLTNADTWYYSEETRAALAELEVDPSPTHYFAVRRSAQRVLYDLVNSNAMRNGLNVDFEAEVYEFNGNEAANYRINVTPDMVGTNDIKFTSASGLPEGVVMASNGMLSGLPTTSGTYSAIVTFACDSWVTSTLDLTINVLDMLPFAGNCDLTDLTAGTEVSGCFANENFAIGTKYDGQDIDSLVITAAGVPAGMSIAEDGTVSGAPEAAGTYNVVLTINGHVKAGGSRWAPKAAKSFTLYQPVTIIVK